MTPRFEAPRGTHDILPSEQPLWRWVTGTMEDVCRVYGYRPIQTPGIEDTDLIIRTSGEGSDVVQKETYTFTDRGDRSLTLRPEGTAPICRAYVEHGLHREPQPQKLYTIGPFWRYDRPQKGRYREHWQLSVEAIGSDDPAIDAEIIQLYDHLLARLGVTNYVLKLNSIGDGNCRPAYVEALSAWLDEHDAELDEEARAKRRTSPAARLRREERTRAGSARRRAEDRRLAVRRVPGALRARARVPRRVGVRYELEPTLVRGLDYYTRTTFEFQDEAIGAQSTICGGGRYDGLIETIGGPPTPGIGFGAGVERLQLSLGTPDLPRDEIDVFFAVGEGGDRAEVIATMAQLRARGLACDTDYAGRSKKGQLTQAGRLGAKTVVVVDADGARIVRQGGDEPTSLAELAATLGA